MLCGQVDKSTNKNIALVDPLNVWHEKLFTSLKSDAKFLTVNLLSSFLHTLHRAHVLHRLYRPSNMRQKQSVKNISHKRVGKKNVKISSSCLNNPLTFRTFKKNMNTKRVWNLKYFFYLSLTLNYSHIKLGFCWRPEYMQCQNSMNSSRRRTPSWHVWK